MVSGIYKILSPTGKIYIGQSKDIYRRWKFYSFYNCKNQIKLYNSFKKYGPENHVFEIVEECFIEQLNEREIYWGTYYEVLGENGLNLRLGETNSIYSDESKEKMSKSHLGKAKSQQHRNNIKKSKSGIKFSQQHKDNMSASRFRYSIICVENNKIYKSANQASKELNISPASIIKVCKGIFKQAKGYTFKFTNNE